MASNGVAIGRDSMGFEDIDEFWDAPVAPSVKSATKENDQNRKTNARRSSMSTDVTQDTDLETFDYDTSDSIEEEDDEEEVVGKRERNSKISGRNSEGKNGDLSPNAVATAPGRKSRGSIGARQSMMSNMSTGSSLGGTLPLADSDDDTDALRGSDRLSLDSSYDTRSSAGSELSRVERYAKDGKKGGDSRRKSPLKDSTDRKRSTGSLRDGAQGRIGGNEKNVPEEDYLSDDTTDMSAIPVGPGSHSHNESMGSRDGITPFGDDFGDNNDSVSDAQDNEGEGDVRKRGERRGSSSSSGKTNRRVSFGMGTKAEMEEEEGGEEGSDMGDQYESAGDLNMSVSVRSGEDSSPSARDKSNRSVLSMTPRSSSSSSSSSSSRKGKYSMGETPGSHEFTRGRIVADESFVIDTDDKELENSDSDGGGGDGDDDNDDATAGDRSYVEDTSFLKAIKNRIVRQENGITSRRDSRASTDHEDDDEDELEEEEEEEEDEGGGMRGSRRSSRVTKGKRLAYWRGERPVYQKGRMVGMLVADKTPSKPKKKITKTKVDTKKRKAVGFRTDLTDSEDDENPDKKMKNKFSNNLKKSEVESKIILPHDVKFLKRESSDEMAVWDDLRDAPVTVKVLCHAESLKPFSALPVTAIRPPGKEKVGFAAQSFNIPEVTGTMSGWISGFVMLPPGAIKDAEGVGECSQVFFVSECQDGAVELGIADPRHDEWRDDMAQRTLMHKGDSFFVPPGNIYRLENHSSSTPATLFWAIVRPLDGPQSPVPSSASPESVQDLFNSILGKRRRGGRSLFSALSGRIV